jgi:hypothetical protein
LNTRLETRLIDRAYDIANSGGQANAEEIGCLRTPFATYGARPVQQGSPRVRPTAVDAQTH